MTDVTTNTPSPADIAAAHPTKQYTQAEVDAMVRDAMRKQREQHADYDELKAKAEQADLAHERTQSLEQDIANTRLDNLRITVANDHSISHEDRDALLTATDEAGLRAQAERLAALNQSRPAGGLVARREGGSTVVPSSDDDTRAFLRELMGGSEW